MRKRTLALVLLISLGVGVVLVYRGRIPLETGASQQVETVISTSPVFTRPILTHWSMGDRPVVSQGEFTFAAHVVVIDGERVTVLYSLSGPDAAEPLDSSSVQMSDERGVDQPQGGQAYPAPTYAFNPRRVLPLAYLDGLQLGAIIFEHRYQGARQLHVLIRPSPQAVNPLDAFVARVYGPPKEGPPLSGAPNREGYLEQAGYRLSFNHYGLHKGDPWAAQPNTGMATEAAASPATPEAMSTSTIVPVAPLALELSGGKPIDFAATLRIEDLTSGQVNYLFLVLLVDGDVKARLEPEGDPMTAQVSVPPGPITTEEGAIAIARKAAAGWGEPNPQLVSVLRISRQEFLDQLRARGEEVAVAGSGDIWIVQFSGKFKSSHQRFGWLLRYGNMQVFLDSETGDVLSVGGRGPAEFIKLPTLPEPVPTMPTSVAPYPYLSEPGPTSTPASYP